MPTLDFPGMLTIVIAGALVLTPFLRDQSDQGVPGIVRASHPAAPAMATDGLPFCPAG